MASTSSNRPASGAVRITPSDSATFSVTRGINVESSGLVYADWENGSSNVPVYVSAGGVFPANVKRIYATGTTASGITVLY
jgi:hypothetical protein